MKKILVVGAGGQIGSELVPYLRSVYGAHNVVATGVRECKNLSEDGQLSTRLNADTTLPKFFYSSTMHGDEVTGYYFMLRLIDTLVNGVENDVQIQNILSSSIVYINPLSNPDGTYYSGDNNVSGSIPRPTM